MKILKKLVSLLICSAITTVSPLYAAASNNPSISFSETASSITGNMKGAGVYIKWKHNSSETYATNSRRDIYDVYVKYDTGKFNSSDYTSVITPLSGKIETVRCIHENDDGSYTSPDIVGFEPNQIDSLRLEFAQNGVYTLYATASSGTTAEATIDVVAVSDPRDANDTTSPEITDKIIDFQSGRSVTYNIESNELCRLEINGTVYSKCTGVNYTITESGQYKVTATDVNGNTSTKIIVVDNLGGSLATTAPPTPPTTTTPTTTKPTTTTTTTTTIEPTTAPTTTTTTEPTTAPTTTTTTEPTTAPTTTTTTEPTTAPTTTTTTEPTTAPTTTTTTEPTTAPTTTTTTEPTTTTTTDPTTTMTTVTEPQTTVAPTTEPPVITTTAPPSDYSIAPIDESELYVGNTVKLDYLSPDGQFPQVWWVESSNYDIASCQNNYEILLKGEGTVTLTAHCANDVNVSITLNVKSAQSAETTTTTKLTTTTSPTTSTTTSSTTSTTPPTTTTTPTTTEPVYTLGDVNGDDKIDSSDASAVLVEYSKRQTGQSSALTDIQKKAADVNHDGIIDSTDASLILVYYSASSTGKHPSFG